MIFCSGGPLVMRIYIFGCMGIFGHKGFGHGN